VTLCVAPNCIESDCQKSLPPSGPKGRRPLAGGFSPRGQTIAKCAAKSAPETAIQGPSFIAAAMAKNFLAVTVSGADFAAHSLAY